MSEVFVQRDAIGQIVGLLRRAPAGGEAASGQWHSASAHDDDVQAFLKGVDDNEMNPLAGSDATLARVTEDLIDVLIDKGLIQFTDLPVAAQNKLLQRRQTRSALANRLNLLGDSDII